MHTPCWQLEEHVARLESAPLKAKVDLARPADGLREVCPHECRPLEARLLGVVPSSSVAGETAPLVESHARGADLTAAYGESSNRPVRVGVRWRVKMAMPSEQFLVALELVVSVRTEVPHARPGLAAQSSLPAAEVLRLTGVDPLHAEPLGGEASLCPEDGPGCIIFRPPDATLTYAEMVHPADFQSSQLSSAADGETTCIRHRLLSDSLERGVIRRARILGVFLPREDDVRLVADCYRAFAAAEPPLSG